MKEMNDRVVQKIMSKAAISKNLTDAQFVGKINNNILFSFWMTIFLATVATPITGYVLLAINFAVNMKLCYNTVRLQRKTFQSHSAGKYNQSCKKQTILELVLHETIEALVPIAFIVSYLIVFYGPNNNIIGNVGCGYWTFQKVENLNDFLLPVILMALPDFGSGVLSGILLWKYCSVNILLEYCSAIKKYWSLLASYGATNLIGVRISLNY